MTSSQKHNMEEIRIAFKKMDKDRDGFVSFDDLKRTMTECKENLSDSELHRMITDADLDLDGRVCYTGTCSTCAVNCFFSLLCSTHCIMGWDG